MNEIPLPQFLQAAGLFRDQVRGEFGNRIVADILEPMSRELEALSAEAETTQDEIAALENQLTEQD